MYSYYELIRNDLEIYKENYHKYTHTSSVSIKIYVCGSAFYEISKFIGSRNDNSFLIFKGVLKRLRFKMLFENKDMVIYNVFRLDVAR